MSADPDIGGTWMTAADFIDRTALTSAPTGFPAAPGGSLAGATSVSRLARLPPASRASTTLGQILAPVPPAYLAAPDDPAAPLVGHPPLADDLAAIVISHGRRA